MESQIIERQRTTDAWLTGLGEPTMARMLAWEQQQADELLADVFGYHAVQLGWPQLDALRFNRMPHRWGVHVEYELPWSASDPTTSAALSMDSRAWPWSADSLDLVVLPHTLERSADPHACLREVERVLIPEGQLLITGLNPLSFWGWRQRRQTQASQMSWIGYRRLRDWLRLLGFEVQISRFEGWGPALNSERWMQRLAWMDRWGERWVPMLGGVYLLMATKRVHGGRLLDGRRWRTVRSPAAATVPLARADIGMAPASLTSKDSVESR